MSVSLLHAIRTAFSDRFWRLPSFEKIIGRSPNQLLEELTATLDKRHLANNYWVLERWNRMSATERSSWVKRRTGPLLVLRARGDTQGFEGVSYDLCRALREMDY